jgi:hypothetical protein
MACPIRPRTASRRRPAGLGGVSATNGSNLPRHEPLFAAAILRPANSAYSRSASAPAKNRPNSLAATPVVPDPLKGSKRRSLVEANTARRRRRRGFRVGWRTKWAKAE